MDNNSNYISLQEAAKKLPIFAGIFGFVNPTSLAKICFIFL